MKKYTFEVTTVESGQRAPYGDSYYSYLITSERPQDEVEKFCRNILQVSYEFKDMPNPFSNKFIEFKRITDNNKGKHYFDNGKPETYSYKLKSMFTD